MQSISTKWKKPMTEGHTLYDFDYMTFWKKTKHGDTQMVSGCQGLKREELVWSAEDFQDDESTLTP